MSDETRPKLLLADDSATIRKVVELTFADEGIEVFTVTNAEAAMLKFVEVQPDIVLVDVGLSGTNGYRICEMIKQDGATRHIPVLLLVGSFEPFDQELAEKAECDGFLTKPFHSIRDLVLRVWDLLGRQRVPVPETEDIENLYESSFAQTMEMHEYDTLDDLLGDTGMDDEMIEASFPTDAGNGGVVELPHPDATKEFDWPPENPMTEVTADSSNFSPKFIFDEPIERPSEYPPVVKSNEPSPEMISLITERVLERLSDRVVREIAREAVPRIAEKLIREALDEEKSSSQ